jgi:hypothetical protein
MAQDSLYFSVDVPDAEIIWAIGKEAALDDAAIDSIEAGLRDSEASLAALAASALVLGRCGRKSSKPCLEALRLTRFAESQDQAAVLILAAALIDWRPRPWVERADSGYRVKMSDGRDLFVEDPLAAHWHHAHRWGPPIRPRIDAPFQVVSHPDELDDAVCHALDGGVVVVALRERELWSVRGARSALYISKAGFAYRPDLSDLIRWSQLSSLGSCAHLFGSRIAYRLRNGRLVKIPERSFLPTDMLLAMMTQVMKGAGGIS